MKNKLIRWDCETRGLGLLSREIRRATRLLIAPLSLEIPVVSPWNQENDEKDVSPQEIEAMIWLLGFWIGNGHESALSFTLAGDADVKNRFDESAKMWGMKSIPKDDRKNK